MAGQVMHALLSSGEYDEIEDVVVADGEFIEMDADRKAIRQVVLGLTPYNLIIAERILTDYKKHPEVYFLTDVDPYLMDLEVASAWPICLLRIGYTHTKFNLSIVFYNVMRHYVMTNTHFNGDLLETWSRWQDRVIYIREDPYGYIRSQFDQFGFPYPDYYAKLTANKDTNSNETYSKNNVREFDRNRETDKRTDSQKDSGSSAGELAHVKKKNKRFSKNWFKNSFLEEN